MLKIIKDYTKKEQLLKPAFEGSIFPAYVGKKNFKVTDELELNESYVYFDKDHQTWFEFSNWFKSFAGSIERDYVIDLESFSNFFDYKELLRMFIFNTEFAQAKLFKKTNEKSAKAKEKTLSILVKDESKEVKEIIKKVQIISESVTKARNLQIMPENFLNSEMLASEIVNDFSGINNLKIEVLTKKEIQDLNMGLLLSVNKGSTHEPRVVVISYNGNKGSKEHTSIVGKGITFDTGGVNTKGYHMDGMKYDMSGSVIAAYAVKTLALLGAKVNASAVMCITDNRINADASLPENVYQSMSGKWVEVVDTDAEGRLVLADGIYYSADKLKPTTILDVATLTGSIITSLSNVYSGIWSTNEDKWEIFEKAAKKAQEKVWRMPLHKDFHKGNSSSKVADLASWSSKVKQDSSQAAMFLKEFTKDIDFIHCDVAGTADRFGEPQGELISTLVEFIIDVQK
ncbi:leucyl aminopeptidase [Mycoplasmopsis canis UFG4]|uniref:Probable cytosol aminopeptidase n=1 Tax=Mycoplasmopsis canis UFG4 TaxID=1131455 RepID=I1A4H6_9BACT|nr:peptidase M17 [Mycoplasmopsis canis]EIE41245.1 leucyl aminopeptidase [Mycoplasmopsis canis UFG1]EIE41397.1 leucyl aminopeptidase [Mycoplasmopsis canis UFG4]